MRSFLFLFLLVGMMWCGCEEGGRVPVVRSEVEGQTKKEKESEKEVDGEGKAWKDSAGYVGAQAGLVMELLGHHPAFGWMDTTVVMDGYEGKVRIDWNRISTGGANAMAEVHDNDRNPIFFFVRGPQGWWLKQTIFPPARMEPNGLQLEDFNFDGFNDLGIVWNYTAGRCSCTAPGCLDVYIYDYRLDSLVHVPQIAGYLDVHIDDNEKVLYLGEHCEGFFGRFGWKGDSLQKLEEYVVSMQKDGSQLAEHNVYNGKTKKTVSRSDNFELPDQWMRIFWTNKRNERRKLQY